MLKHFIYLVRPWSTANVMPQRSLVLAEGWSGGNMGAHPSGPKEIDGLLVPPGKANILLADHLITS